MSDDVETLSFHLDGRRALVTGSASGIGYATAELLAFGGARVAMNDLPGERLDTAVERLRSRGLDVVGAAGDLSSSATVAQVAAHATDALGGLDYLVNNAGAPLTRQPIAAADLDALSDEFWDRILRVNLLSAFWMTKALAPQLREAAGAVVNTVSTAAFSGGGSSIAYATAKSGLAGLTRELARALAPRVRVNGIAPGLVNSPWECSFGDLQAWARDTVPLQTVGQPSDYAQAIGFLCAGARYVTGQVLIVSGGMGI